MHRDLAALFHDLAQRLHRIVQFDFLTLTLHNAAQDTMRLHILESDEPNDVEPGMESPTAESMSGWVWQNQRPLVIPDMDAESRYPRLTKIIRDRGICSLCLVPLTTAQRRLGAASEAHERHRRAGHALQGGAGTENRCLDDAVPFAASLASPRPFRCWGAAVLTDEAGRWLGQRRSSGVWQ